MEKVIQISDTHLSRNKAHFVENWRPLVDWLEKEDPSLIIHTGDISLDGADVDDDFTFCRELTGMLRWPMLVVPGNHDVGQFGSPHQPVDPERLARWNLHYKADHWVHDLPGWRLIGFNSMLCSTGLPQEQDQLEWLELQMAGADRRNIAWFCHQPLFIRDWDDGDNGYWSVKPEPRRKLRALADRYRVALVGSGHVHLSHDIKIGGTEFLWGPSAAFTVGEALQEPLGGEKLLGAVRYEFLEAGFEYERIHLPDLRQMWIDDVVAEVYPPR